MGTESARFCRKCSQEKPVSDFYPNNKRSCRECLLAEGRAKRLQQKERREQRKAQDRSLPLPYRFTGGKVCQKCSQRKPRSAFYDTSLTCKECVKAEAKERRNAKREKEKADFAEMLLSMPFHERIAFLDRRRRERHYRQNYGMSLARFDAMYREQEGKCAICREEQNSVDLYVDHDHSLGLVRGLLCKTCNAGIGMLKDSPEVLFNAAKYLSKFHNDLEGWIS